MVGALLLSAYQTRQLAADSRQRDEERRVELALNLYRDLVVDGDTANAFHRLSVGLRKVGTARHNTITWYLPKDDDLGVGGLMDPSADADGSDFADLYRVMWFFERAHIALTHGLIAKEVFFEAAGFHVWWWNEILRDIEGPKAMSALRALAVEVDSWARSTSRIDSWRSRCMTDFNGGPASSGISN